MKKIILLPSFLLLLSTALLAQTELINNLYNYDPKLLNPAFAGLKDEQNYSFQYRGDLDGRAQQQFLTAFSLALPKIKSGIGGLLWQSESGAYTSKNVGLMYNYQLTLNTGDKLSFGTQVGYSLKELSSTIYHSLNPNDSKIIPDKYSQNFFRASLGAVFQHDKLSIGIDVRDVLQSKVGGDNSASINSFSTSRYYEAFGSYDFVLKPNLRITPSLLIESDFDNTTAIDFNGIIEFRKFLFGINNKTVKQPNLTLTNYTYYSAGIKIAGIVQFLIVFHDGYYSTGKASNTFVTETMLRVVVPNKRSN